MKNISIVAAVVLAILTAVDVYQSASVEPENSEIIDLGNYTGGTIVNTTGIREPVGYVVYLGGRNV